MIIYCTVHVQQMPVQSGQLPIPTAAPDNISFIIPDKYTLINTNGTCLAMQLTTKALITNHRQEESYEIKV